VEIDHEQKCAGNIAVLCNETSSQAQIGCRLTWLPSPEFDPFDKQVSQRDKELMRYLVRARVTPSREAALLRAIEDGSLGRGSVAGGEYLRNMSDARLCDDGTVRWVEICFCCTPLQEERPYWEEYFEFERIQDAHDRRKCRDKN